MPDQPTGGESPSESDVPVDPYVADEVPSSHPSPGDRAAARGAAAPAPEGASPAGGSGPGHGGEGLAPAVPTRIERRVAEHARRRRRRHRIYLWTGASLLVLLLLVVGAAIGFLYYESHRIHHYDIKHLKPVETSGADKNVENILLIGSTTRCGLKEQNAVYGLCSEGVTGVNSDVVMILHLDPIHHRESILSIPRDTFVPNAHADGVNKIDAALGDPAGPSQLVAAIEEDFGIPINHYVELNFDGFAGVVDALGGIKMYFPMPVYDAQSHLWEPNPGCIPLNGAEALAVVRARHLQYQPASAAGELRMNWPYDPQSDLSRIRRDHEFLRVLASAVSKRGLGNFITDLQLINSLAPNISVDQGFSTIDMANLVLAFRGVNPDSVPQYTLPVVVDGEAYYYNGASYGDVVFPMEPEDSQVIDAFLGTTPNQDGTGHALPAPGSVTVSIENGSSNYDAGEQSAAALQELGYHVVSVTDTLEPSPTSETSILYSSLAQQAAALRVKTAFSGLTVLGYNPGLAGGTPTGTIDVGTALPSADAADVVVVLGSNFAVASPPATTTTAPGTTTSSPTTSTTTTTTSPSTTSPSTTTTTVPSVLADNPELAAPSPSTEPLEPWDPRSCTASGGEGP